MSLLDSPQGFGGTLVVLLGGGLKLLTAYLEWRKGREVKKATSKVPPSPQLEPPKTDPAVLARLDCMDAANALSVSLMHTRLAVDERDRRIRDLERELADMAGRLRVLEAAKGIADSLIHAKNQDIARLQDELTRLRFRPRSGVTELPAEHEHRDASTSSTLQDALPTPLRPPRR
jgi:hypothetical protein